MDLGDRLASILACPYDHHALNNASVSLACPLCGRMYPREEGIVHFVTTEDTRPDNPARLAQNYAEELPDRLDVEWYRRQATRKEEVYRSNREVRDAVDSIVARSGTVVDLATGAVGAYVVPIVRRLGPGAVLFATDACLPVVRNWYECLRTDFADRFAFLDIDLKGSLCFADGTVDTFSGVGIANVNEGNPEPLLHELRRCLKPDGVAVLEERFYGPQSASTALLARLGNIYLSLDEFANRARAMGLQVVAAKEASRGRGKSDPRDGMPIDDHDEWSEVILYLRTQR